MPRATLKAKRSEEYGTENHGSPTANADGDQRGAAIGTKERVKHGVRGMRVTGEHGTTGGQSELGGRSGRFSDEQSARGQVSGDD